MRNIIIIYVLLILAVLGLAYYQRNNLPFLGKKTPTAKIDNKTYNLILAKTDDQKRTGLSGRDKLDSDSGMLFIFDGKDYYKFWMPLMKFSIDIIYIDDNKIVDIKDSVPTPPANIDMSSVTCQTDANQTNAIPCYTPQKPANYVLEINAGESKKNGFKVGDTVTLNNVK